MHNVRTVNEATSEATPMRDQIRAVLLLCIMTSGSALAQTTLFGTTLGKPDPQLGCGAFEAVNRLQGDYRSSACGLGDDADTGPSMDVLDGNVEHIEAWWQPVFCTRVEAALKAKLGPPIRSSWRGRNGLGLPIGGTVWTWNRKDGDVIRFSNPSPSGWPDCGLDAATAKWRSRSKEGDHL